METQDTIRRWISDTFPLHVSVPPWEAVDAAISRLDDEVHELKSAYHRNDIMEEAADVYISLMGVAERVGFDLGKAVDRKMEINRKRKWTSNPDGTGKHVKETGDEQ